MGWWLVPASVPSHLSEWGKGLGKVTERRTESAGLLWLSASMQAINGR